MPGAPMTHFLWPQGDSLADPGLVPGLLCGCQFLFVNRHGG